VTNVSSRKAKLEEWKKKKKQDQNGGFLRRRSRSVETRKNTPYDALRKKLMTRSAVKAPPQRVIQKKEKKRHPVPPGSQRLKTTLQSMRSPFRSSSKRIARKNIHDSATTKRVIKHRTISTPMQKKMHKRNKNRRYNANQIMMWTSDFEVAVLDIDCKMNAKDFHNARKILNELEKNPNMTKIDMKQKTEFWRLKTSLLSFEGDSIQFESAICEAEKSLSPDKFENMKRHFKTCRSRLPKSSSLSPPPMSPPTNDDAEEDNETKSTIRFTPMKGSFMKCATPSSALKRPVALGFGGSARRIRTPSISRVLLDNTKTTTSEELGTARRVLTGKKPPRSSRKNKKNSNKVIIEKEELGTELTFEVIENKTKKKSFLTPVRRSTRNRVKEEAPSSSASLHHLNQLLIASKLEQTDFHYRPNVALKEEEEEEEIDSDISTEEEEDIEENKTIESSTNSEELGSQFVTETLNRKDGSQICTPVRRSKRLNQNVQTPALLG